MKLIRDLLVIALACGGYYYWKHRPAPPPPPPPIDDVSRLAMPSSAGKPLPRGEQQNAMQVEKESLGRPEVHAPGQRSRPKTLGETAQLLSGGAAPSLDDPGEAPAVELEKPSWLDKAATPQGVLALFGVFAIAYLLLSRGLNRGPGGRGLTHD